MRAVRTLTPANGWRSATCTHIRVTQPLAHRIEWAAARWWVHGTTRNPKVASGGATFLRRVL